jgi:hypothetical protein
VSINRAASIQRSGWSGTLMVADFLVDDRAVGLAAVLDMVSPVRKYKSSSEFEQVIIEKKLLCLSGFRLNYSIEQSIAI